MGDAPKLDWMYAGPAGHVNPDEYLMGRAVDKTFEQFKLGGAEVGNQDLPPPTLPRSKSIVPAHQVDVARKVQEDPLLVIRKREEERKAVLREQLLIQQRLSSQSKKHQNEQMKKEPENGKAHGTSVDNDLDDKLAKKLLKFKASKKSLSLDERIAEKLRNLKEKNKRESSSSSSSSSDSSSGSESESESKAQNILRTSDRCEKPKYEPGKIGSHQRPINRTESGKASARVEHATKSRSSDADYDRRNQRYWKHSRRSRSRSRSRRSRSRSPERLSYRPDKTRHSRDSSNDRRDYHGATFHVHFKDRDSRDSRKDIGSGAQRNPSGFQRNRTRAGLTEEELEQRRREMMQHAVMRDEERRDKVEKYRKEIAHEDAELNAARPKEAAFVRKELASITAETSVEARIKANVFNIQRSVNSMNSNFAKR